MNVLNIDQIIQKYYDVAQSIDTRDRIKRYAQSMEIKCNESNKFKLYDDHTAIALSSIVELTGDRDLYDRFQDRDGVHAIQKEITCAHHLCEMFTQRMDLSGIVKPLLPIYADTCPRINISDALRVEHLGRIISVAGIIIRAGVSKVLLDTHMYQCSKCKLEIELEPYMGVYMNYPTEVR